MIEISGIVWLTFRDQYPSQVMCDPNCVETSRSVKSEDDRIRRFGNGMSLDQESRCADHVCCHNLTGREWAALLSLWKDAQPARLSEGYNCHFSCGPKATIGWHPTRTWLFRFSKTSSPLHTTNELLSIITLYFSAPDFPCEPSLQAPAF